MYVLTKNPQIPTLLCVALVAFAAAAPYDFDDGKKEVSCIFAS